MAPKKYIPHPLVPRLCEECGTERLGNAKMKYCGDTCRQRATRKRLKLHSPAHTAVTVAIKKGQLIRPFLCENCNQPDEAGLHAHHDDYSKHLEVRWLCRSCHKRHHNGTLVPGERSY